MEVTFPGIVIDVRPEHHQYMYMSKYQLFVVNTVEKWLVF